MAEIVVLIVGAPRGIDERIANGTVVNDPTKYPFMASIKANKIKYKLHNQWNLIDTTANI